jgi:hypothetical protein
VCQDFHITIVQLERFSLMRLPVGCFGFYTTIVQLKLDRLVQSALPGLLFPYYYSSTETINREMDAPARYLFPYYYSSTETIAENVGMP